MVQFNLPKNSKIVKGKTYGKPNNLSLQIYRWNREDGSNPRIDTFNLDKKKDRSNGIGCYNVYKEQC